ncbi:uncharacterized protein LOC124148338 [Haliotis rufescens]|uniref:uncharacterized protein LOC124148338 n=1 Tax=Haliotis rufescens TaxID=6454 RepID=UPI00201EBD7D|nr:uncharacterized protein LOC124148338 [Haliotis rufescens]
MSCQSGGMDINQQHQLEHFGFSSKLNVYVVNEDEEEDETEVKDYGPILECFRDVKELNQLLPQNIEVVSVTQEQIAWRVSSQKTLTKWFETIRKLSNLLTEFAVNTGLVKRLNLQTGYRLDFDIVSPDARELKIKAKKHFQEVRSSLAKGPNGEPSLNLALSKPLTTVTKTPGTPAHSEVTAIVPNQESSSSIPDPELSDVSGAHSGGPDKYVLATNTQLCHDDSLPTTTQAKVDMKALKPGNICKETEAKLPYSTETDSHKMTTPPLPDVADSSSVDFDVCGGQTTISGREQSKVSSTKVILYVPEEYSAWSVKMKYAFSGNKKGTVVKMEYDKESKLWFSEKIQCPLDTTFSYAFDIFKRFAVIYPSHSDKDFTRCPHLTSVIRTLKGSSYEEGCTHHLHHIASGRSCVSIGGNLIEVDNLCKLANLDLDKKNGIFTRFTSLLEKPLKQSKVLAILAYLIGKWDIHHQTLITCSVSPLEVLTSFMIFRPDVLSRQQLKVLQCSAPKVVKAAFQETACVLLLMKYCLHLFPCSYFIRLQKENKFTFSSRDTDTDFNLHEELFHKLACVVSQENADSESSFHLFDLFIEYTNVFHILKFPLEKYPNLIERIQRLISNSVKIELKGIKSNRNWNKLREVCEVVSKHPSLVDIYSADLTEITFGMMRSLGGHTPLPGDTLKKILMSKALFVQRHEKETLITIVSRSQCEQLHGYYLEIVENWNIAQSVISESMCVWLENVIKRLSKNTNYETPVDYLTDMYVRLCELLRVKKISQDQSLSSKLKEKVFQTVSAMDVELVLKKCLQKGFRVDDLFFTHLEQITDDLNRGRYFVLKLHELLTTSYYTYPGMRTIQIGVDTLGRIMPENSEDMLNVILQHWRLCSCALKHSTNHLFRNNKSLKCILKCREKYQRQFQDRHIELHVIRKLKELCKKDDYIALSFLSHVEPWEKQNRIVGSMKQYLGEIEETDIEVKCVLDVLLIMRENAPPLQQLMKTMQGKAKDFDIGLDITIKCIVDRSFFGEFKSMLKICKMNRYLWESKVFLKMYRNCLTGDSSLHGDGSLLITGVCDLMEKTKGTFQTYWERLTSDRYTPIADIHMISIKDLECEIQTAEKVMDKFVPQSVKNALQLACDYRMYIHKTAILKRALKVLDLDATKDIKFTTAVSAFSAIETHKDTMHSLITASETFQEIDKLMDRHIVDVLKEFSESTHLLNFIEEIKHEDLRNLIDAVEEHSEQSVQEVTVSSLIDVRRFLRPLIEGSLEDSVLAFLQTVQKSIEENELTKLDSKLKECNTNLHGLRSLYHNVANRGEVTKGIVKALISDDEASFSFKILSSSKVHIVLKYRSGKGEKLLNSNELNDYRSRALLLVNTESKEQDVSLQSELSKFTELVDCAVAIAGLYEQLVSTGHPCYHVGHAMSEQKNHLAGEEQRLRKALSEWKKALEKAREQWYWLNHFYPEQVSQVKGFLVDGLNKDAISSLFQSAGCTPGNLDTAQELYSQHKLRISDLDEFNLNAIGATLDDILGDNIVNGQEFPEDEEFDPSQVRPLERVQEGQLYVLNWNENSAYVIPTLITLYRNTTGLIPCHHQVLFCTEHTTWESIQLLLNRSVGGKYKGFKKQLYCVVHAEKLRNEVQFQFVYKLKELGDKIQYLAVICRGNINHPLVNHFSENIHKLRPMLNIALSNSIKQLWPDVVVVTSDLPGQGKSEQVQCDAFRKGLDIVPLDVSGNITDVIFMLKLKEISLERDSLLHINIGIVSSAEEIDIFIFKLCILGFMSCGASIFPCTTGHVRIEIANTINHTLENDLPTSFFFEKKNLPWLNFTNLRVSQEVGSAVQVVCHYLQKMKDSAVDSTDMYFSGENIEEPLPEDWCRNLLREHFSTIGDLSFSVLNILVNVLADQLKKMSCSLFLRTSSLYSMVGDNTVKSSLLETLISSSTEFATRSVGPCRQEQKQTVVWSKREGGVPSGSSDMATATTMADRVQGMIQWEDSNHLIIAFHSQNIQTFSALYRDLKRIPDHVKTLFETQMNKDLPDFSVLTDSELKDKLKHIAGSTDEPLSQVPESYAMTPDNLLKMILIVMRIKAHIPVIIMGETGCGKTSLLRYLASVCGIHFIAKNMHAGIEEEDVTECVLDAMKLCKEKLEKHVWLFFDEINTCDHLGILNELLCHHKFKGQKLPPNLSIMAACNPYKIRKECNILTAGLVTKVKSDDQSKLVYRVHPLPERMVDYVWDYGSLTESDEKAYISSMVAKTLDALPCELLVDLLVMSQKFIRRVENHPYCVSLRDVNRCRLLVSWFRDDMLAEISDSGDNTDERETEAMIMALAHSYHSRLNESKNREEYRQSVVGLLRDHGLHVDEEFVLKTIAKNQKAVLDQMELPDGIARNTALQENVFVILVCILKHIPIFVVGKPGCSKSLSLQLLKGNLRGKDSKNDYFRKLPQLYYVSYQGSGSSTSDGIIKVFEKAQKYREHNKEEDVLPVVILDEIGLAEVSAYNPLKVLHSLLEPERKEFPDVAVVGISNWALDAAKMNRAVYLSRPDMDVKELHSTAVSIAEFSSEANKSKSIDSTISSDLSREDDSVLEALAYAYFEYVKNQNIKNFHGLRDFYSLVKFISREANSQSAGPRNKFQVVLKGLLRNFSGLESEIKFVIHTFNKHLKQMTKRQPQDLTDECFPSLLKLIDDNIKDTSARHLMLISRGDSSLGIVEDLLRSNKRQYITILGSCFDEDQTDHYSYRILSKIILCMEQGITLILKDLENIYGSLYDMLNQNYTTVGSKKNCRIALGAYSNPLCQVDDSFRCIVLVEEQKVDLSDPPFLNRFEKQRLIINDVLVPETKQIVEQLQSWIKDISKVSDFESMSPTELLPIFSSDLIPSLVHSEYKTELDDREDFQNVCLQKIIKLCTPEGIIRAEKSALITKEKSLVESIREQYFSLPIHDGLEIYLQHMLECCSHGISAMVFTHSNIYVDLPAITQSITKHAQHEKLGSFKSEKQLSSSIQQFWSDTHDWLFIQVSHTDQQHFFLLKSILELEQKRYLSTTTSAAYVKHVVVIIHVDRTTQGSQIGLMNFLNGWDMANVDCLEPHIFPLKDLLEGTLADMAQRLLKKRGITFQNLFEAFACIRYTEKSRSIDSIKSMINLDRVVDVLLERIEEWIKETESIREDRNWQLETACNVVKLKNYMTFQTALLEEIKSTLLHPLAALVFTIERFHGWDCLCTEAHDTMTQEKMALWSRLVLNTCVVDISGVAEPKGPECLPCKMSNFSTKFPFSMYFIHAIENLESIFLDIWRARQTEENDSMDKTARELLTESFRRHVNTVATDMFEYSYGEEQFGDYFHDFCLWFTAKLPLSMSENQMIEVTGHAIRSRTCLDRDSFDMFVTKLHVTAWMFKYQLQSELVLVDTCLSQLNISLDDILKHTYQLRKKVKKIEQIKSNVYHEGEGDSALDVTDHDHAKYERTVLDEEDINKKENVKGDHHDRTELTPTYSEDTTCTEVTDHDHVGSERTVLDEDDINRNEDLKGDHHDRAELTPTYSKDTTCTEERCVDQIELRICDDDDGGDDDGDNDACGRLDHDGEDEKRDETQNWEEATTASCQQVICVHEKIEDNDTCVEKSNGEDLKILQTDPEVIQPVAEQSDMSDGGIDKRFETVKISGSDEPDDRSLRNSGESLEHVTDSDPDETAAAHLVDLACQYLIPSQELRKVQSVKTWQSLVNLVLSLTSDVSVEPMVLQTLRVCSDMASLIILPHGVSETHFWDVGSKLSTDTLDSEHSELVLQDLIRKVSCDVPSKDLKHFLSSYASCCLMANAETDFVARLSGIYYDCGEEGSDVAFLGSVLHHSIYLQFDHNPEEMMTDSLLENEFFKVLDEWLKRSQVQVDDSPLACIIADLLQNHIFGNVSEQLQKGQSEFLDKLLELKRQYIGSLQVTFKLLVLVAYLKSALQSLVNLIETNSLKDNTWQKINQLFEGGMLHTTSRMQGMQTYFLKCLTKGGGFKACMNMKINWSNFIEYMTTIKPASDKTMTFLEQNPMVMSCTSVFLEIQKAANCLTEGDVNPLQTLLQEKSADVTYSLFAYTLKQFYLASIGRTQNRSEEDASSKLIEEAKNQHMPDHQMRLFSRLCQQEAFGVFFLQVPSTVTDYHMVSPIIDILSTVISAVPSLDSKASLHVFLECICNPCGDVRRSIPGCSDETDAVSTHSDCDIMHGRSSIHFLDCECGYRNVFSVDSNCPNCSRELDQVEVMADPLVTKVSDDYYACKKLTCWQTVRGMPQVVFRVLQFIYFSCLTGALALRYANDEDLRTLLCLDKDSDVTNHFNDRLLCHWECLKTLLSMGDEQLNRFMHIVLRQSRVFLTDVKWHVGTKEERHEFEMYFSETISPLVQRRYEIIKEDVEKFKHIYDMEDWCLQDSVCEVFEEGKRYESLPHLWREVTRPNPENLKMQFILTSSNKMFPLLSLILYNEQELNLTKHIWNVIQWHICTVKHISYRYKKRECSKKTLADFRHSLNGSEHTGEEVKQTLDDFLQSWIEIAKMKSLLDMYDDDLGQLDIIHPNTELEKCIVVNEESQIYKVLEVLLRMQNRILDEAMTVTVLQDVLSSSFLMRSSTCATVPIVKVEDIKEQHIMKGPEFDELLKFSQCNTKCGHGREVTYDFFQIEKEVAIQCLLNKAYITIGESFPTISFSGEIQHTTASLLQEIEQLLEQEPLSPEMEHLVDKMDPADRKVLMNYLEMTFCLIKRTPVSPKDRKRFLTDFLDSWQYLFPYRVETIHGFCSNINLYNIVALYEAVEKHMASDVVDSLEDKFRKEIPREALAAVSQVVIFGNPSFLQNLVIALSKYAYRYLQTQDADPEQQLSDQLKNPSLWPKGLIERLYAVENDEEKEVGLLPPSICAEHIFHVVMYYRQEIKKEERKAVCGDVRHKQKQTKAVKSKKWKH